METQKDANDKSTRHAMQCKAKEGAQHTPPFMVKIIHWARSSSKEGKEAFRKWKRGPSTKLSHDFGEHPSPFARLCKEGGPTQTPNLVEPDTLQTVKVPFF
jgi:hypothetical protein